MKQFFITSTGTGIGKTALTTALSWQLRQQNKPFTALKPIISGYDPTDPTTDTAQILTACGITPTAEAAERISPWRFQAPQAPMIAAQEEGRQVHLQEILRFCTQPRQGLTLVEGVGGVMVPLNHQHTTADWMQALGWPAILVTGSYLGSISHTLTALEVLRTRNIPVKAIVISESEASTVTMEQTSSMLEVFVPPAIPVVRVMRLPAQADGWKSWPPLSWICDE